MRKMFFAINITIDGFADHTAGIVDDELHDFYTELLSSSETIIMGRKTFQLMESFWPKAHEYPESNKSILRFADRINSMQKIVFSRTLVKSDWSNTVINKNDLLKETAKLKNQSGRDLSVGGLSIASALSAAGLIDEYWFQIHPILLGKGKPLFEDLTDRVDLKLKETRSLNSGVIITHYERSQ
jgi:dihydrofolate reductase